MDRSVLRKLPKRFRLLRIILHARCKRNAACPIGIIESDWGGTPAEAWTPWNDDYASPTLKAHYIDEYMKGGDKAPTNLGKPRKAWRPGELYNGMIAPLEPFAFRGAIWYQGEANAHGAKAKEYRLLLATMITKWRAQFGHDFPFLIVQLAPFIAPPSKNSRINRKTVIGRCSANRNSS